MLLFSIFFFAVFFSGALQLLFILISKKPSLNSLKLSPFECGFLPFFKSQMPLTIQFFSMAIIFLIFDIELLLLFPCLVFFFLDVMIMGLMVFLLFISFSFILEWKIFMLEWKK